MPKLFDKSVSKQNENNNVAQNKASYEFFLTPLFRAIWNHPLTFIFIAMLLMGVFLPVVAAVPVRRDNNDESGGEIDTPNANADIAQPEYADLSLLNSRSLENNAADTENDFYFEGLPQTTKIVLKAPLQRRKTLLKNYWEDEEDSLYKFVLPVMPQVKFNSSDISAWVYISAIQSQHRWICPGNRATDGCDDTVRVIHGDQRTVIQGTENTINETLRKMIVAFYLDSEQKKFVTDFYVNRHKQENSSLNLYVDFKDEVLEFNYDSAEFDPFQDSYFGNAAGGCSAANNTSQCTLVNAPEFVKLINDTVKVKLPMEYSGQLDLIVKKEFDGRIYFDIRQILILRSLADQQHLDMGVGIGMSGFALLLFAFTAVVIMENKLHSRYPETARYLLNKLRTLHPLGYVQEILKIGTNRYAHANDGSEFYLEQIKQACLIAVSNNRYNSCAKLLKKLGVDKRYAQVLSEDVSFEKLFKMSVEYKKDVSFGQLNPVQLLILFYKNELEDKFKKAVEDFNSDVSKQESIKAILQMIRIMHSTYMPISFKFVTEQGIIKLLPFIVCGLPMRAPDLYTNEYNQRCVDAVEYLHHEIPKNIVPTEQDKSTASMLLYFAHCLLNNNHADKVTDYFIKATKDFLLSGKWVHCEERVDLSDPFVSLSEEFLEFSFTATAMQEIVQYQINYLKLCADMMCVEVVKSVLKAQLMTAGMSDQGAIDYIESLWPQPQQKALLETVIEMPVTKQLPAQYGIADLVNKVGAVFKNNKNGFQSDTLLLSQDSNNSFDMGAENDSDNDGDEEVALIRHYKH